MTGRTLFTLLFVFSLRSHLFICHSTGVTVTFEVANQDEIGEGSDVYFTCIITGDFDDSTDNAQFVRQTNADMYQFVLATEMGLSSFAPSNMQFLWWQTVDGTSTLGVSLLNVSRSDSGEYTCQVLRPVVSGHMILDREMLTLDVKYPPAGQPVCDTIPSRANFTWDDGVMIKMTCFSHTGHPQINLQWRNTGMVSLPDADIFKAYNDESGDSIMSSISIEVDESFQGVIFTCARQSDYFPSRDESCMIGPFTVQGINTPMATSSMVTQSSSKGIEAGVVAGIASGAALLTILIIVIILVLARSGRCKCDQKTDRVSNKDITSTRKDAPMSVVVNSKTTLEEDGHDNPVPVKHIISPNGGVEYAVVQKRPSNDATDSNGKKYPSPPNYPRPPKERKESIDEGEQYANTGLGTLSGSTSDLLTVIKNVIQQSPDKDDGQLDIPAYANTADATPTLQRRSVPSESYNVDGDGEETMYANASEIGSRPKSDPTIVTRMASDTEDIAPMYANTANTVVDETSPEHNHEYQEGLTLYANANDINGDVSHLPEPMESPPPPPEEPEILSLTPGLDYADLDLNNQYSSVGTNEKKQNRESVVYASVS